MAEELDNKERALSFIKEQIITCAYPPGSVILLDRIAQELNLSKTPVREALLELQYNGYVTVVPRKRTTVSRISLQDLKDVYDARAMVEIGIIESFRPEDMEEHRGELDALREEWEGMSVSDQSREAYMAFLERDLRFHQAVIGICKNPHLVRFCNELILKSQRFWYVALFNNRMDEVRREHLAILDALRGRKFSIAAEELRKHISISKAMSILSE